MSVTHVFTGTNLYTVPLVFILDRTGRKWNKFGEKGNAVTQSEITVAAENRLERFLKPVTGGSGSLCYDKIRDLCELALDFAVGLTRQVTKGRQMLSRGMSHRLSKGSGWCRRAYRCTKPSLSRHRPALGMLKWADMLILIHWGMIIDDQPCCRIWESLVHDIIQP